MKRWGIKYLSSYSACVFLSLNLSKNMLPATAFSSFQILVTSIFPHKATDNSLLSDSLLDSWFPVISFPSFSPLCFKIAFKTAYLPQCCSPHPGVVSSQLFKPCSNLGKRRKIKQPQRILVTFSNNQDKSNFSYSLHAKIREKLATTCNLGKFTNKLEKKKLFLREKQRLTEATSHRWKTESWVFMTE